MGRTRSAHGLWRFVKQKVEACSPRRSRVEGNLETSIGETPFSLPGDSGSLVRDLNNQVVGLLYGGNLGSDTMPAGAISFACHIADVASAMGVAVPQTATLSGVQKAPANNNPHKAITSASATNVMAKLQNDLLDTEHGLSSPARCSRTKVRALVETNRRIAARWRHASDPHLVAGCHSPRLLGSRTRPAWIATRREAARVFPLSRADRGRKDGTDAGIHALSLRRRECFPLRYVRVSAPGQRGFSSPSQMTRKLLCPSARHETHSVVQVDFLAEQVYAGQRTELIGNSRFHAS
jgi:hypothetical protein